MIKYVDHLSDTICSLITAPGYSGVSVIRVSGEKALNAVRCLCSFIPDSPTTHSIYYGKLLNFENRSLIDYVLVSYFEKGRSFTGDEVLEISCHGSPLIVKNILAQFMLQGIRQAQKGEFSFRAFANGKIDLVQAESINNVIHSSNSVAQQHFLTELGGKNSQEYLNIERGLLEVLSHLEASIDFVEQDISTEGYGQLSLKLDELSLHCQKILDSYDVGKHIATKRRVILFGEANVGKSSLFNSFFNEDRALVSDIPGTTRDIVSENFFQGSHDIKFMDSAGMRATEETLESLGIEKTIEQLHSAEVVLYLFDLTNFQWPQWLEKYRDSRFIFLLNKTDCVTPSYTEEIVSRLKTSYDISIDDIIKISALTGSGISAVRQKLEDKLNLQNSSQESYLTQERHFVHFSYLHKSLQNSLQLLSVEESPDLIAQELQNGLSEIFQLLGKEYDDDVLNNIFSQFCIGK